MARGLNKVQIIGHVGRDPEMRSTQGGQAVTNFTVAVNRNRRDQAGNTTEETEWFRVVCFDKLGEIADQYLRRGGQVFVEGRLQSRKYTDREGIERTAVEVVAGDLVLLGGRQAEEDAGGRAPAPRRPAADAAGGIDPADPPF
jgi:single-strand DNA-binding protein